MKPRNKKEREVTRLSEYLPSLYDQEEWAKKHVFSHIASKCKDELWCSDCGHAWASADTSKLSIISGINDKTECPHCHQNLTVKASRKQKNDEVNYMTIITVCEDYQILRHVYCNRFTHKKGACPYYYFREVVQEWISMDGKRVIMAKPMNEGSSGWLYDHPLSIKNEYNGCSYYADRYSLWGDIYPIVNILPFLKKRGLNKSFHDVSPSKLIRYLLKNDNDYELCLKTKQYSMLQFLYKNGLFYMKYKSSFNICNRNKYKIKDASIWVDYINMLCYFKYDIHNAKYVCPKNIKKEHDKLMIRKQKIQAKLAAERKREEAIRESILRKEGILDFYKNKMRFFGIIIEDNDITVKPLESVTQYYQEAKLMHHCVFSADYYKKNDSLILSARIKDKHIETIEVSLKTLNIIQSRGVCNGQSEFHERIVSLVNDNMNLIRQKIIS